MDALETIAGAHTDLEARRDLLMRGDDAMMKVTDMIGNAGGAGVDHRNEETVIPTANVPLDQDLRLPQNDQKLPYRLKMKRFTVPTAW